MSNEHNEFYQRLIEQVKRGDRNQAVWLLRQFANAKDLVPEPLVTYVAACLTAWLASDCDPKEAPRAFNVQRSPHREESPKIAIKHVRALHMYYLMRGRLKGYEPSISIAARFSHLSESQIRKLLAREDGGLSTEQAAALLAINNPRLRHRCMHPGRKRYHRTR
jgi:hypothetical protein